MREIIIQVAILDVTEVHIVNSFKAVPLISRAMPDYNNM